MTMNNLDTRANDKSPSPNHMAADSHDIHYVRADRGSRIPLRIVLYSGMIAVSILLCVMLYMSRSPKNDDIPVIHAESGPIKIRPQEQPVVPHSERKIYGELAPQEEGSKVENLLAEPEKPQAQTPEIPDDFVNALNEPSSEHAHDNNMTSEASQEHESPFLDHMDKDIPDSQLAKPQISGQPETSEQEASISNGSDAALQDKPLHGEASLPKEKAAQDMDVAKIKVKSSKISTLKSFSRQANTAAEIYRVQISSATSHRGAEQQWASLKKKAGELLSSYEPHILRVDLGTKMGIRYRLQVGQFSRKSAQDFCKRLKQKGIDCWVVRQ